MRLVAEGLSNRQIARRLVRQRGDGEDPPQSRPVQAGRRRPARPGRLGVAAGPGAVAELGRASLSPAFATMDGRRNSGENRDRRTADRPVRQDPAARGRPPARAGGAGGDRAVRRAGALPRARAHLPADPARAVERARRRPRRRAGRRRAGALLAATRCRTRCSSTSPTRWTATAGCSWSSTPPTGWCWSASTARCSKRCCGRRRSRRCSASASTTTPCWSTRPSAAGSSRRCSRSAGRPRTSPATSTARRTRSRCDEDGWALRDYQQQAVDMFWAGGSGVVVLPCGAGKTLVGAAAMAAGAGDHADPGHQHRRRPAVEARAARPHLADRGGDRRVLRRDARRSARSPSPRTR